MRAGQISKADHQSTLTRVGELLSSSDHPYLGTKAYQYFKSVGLECHDSMQPKRQVDHRIAFKLALAEPEIFSRIEKVNSENSNTPEWIGVNDEQCCRYGAIWIHNWISKTDGSEKNLVGTGVQLLKKLESLYAEPPERVSFMNEDLQHQLKEEESVGPLEIAVAGNYQSHPLSIGLKKELIETRIYFCTPVHAASEDDVNELQKQLEITDILITHRVQPGSVTT